MEKPVSLETEPTTTTEHLEEATSGMLRGKQLLSSLFRGGGDPLGECYRSLDGCHAAQGMILSRSHITIS